MCNVIVSAACRITYLSLSKNATASCSTIPVVPTVVFKLEKCGIKNIVSKAEHKNSIKYFGAVA